MPPGMRKLFEQQIAKAEGGALAENKAPGYAEKPGAKTPKYHNKPTERLLKNGNVIRFRSKKEARYFDELCAMERAGQVRKIRLEVQYLIQPAYTDGETGERIKGISYYADFVYEQRAGDGSWEEKIIDTKGGKKGGTRTATYQIKRKLLANQGIKIEES